MIDLKPIKAQLAKDIGGYICLHRDDMAGLVEEVERLRGERAAVVAYLHHRSNLWLNAEKVQRTEASMGVWLVCQAIERGEHRHEEKP